MDEIGNDTTKRQSKVIADVKTMAHMFQLAQKVTER
jgi:hypothetical protein